MRLATLGLAMLGLLVVGIVAGDGCACYAQTTFATPEGPQAAGPPAMDVGPGANDCPTCPHRTFAEPSEGPPPPPSRAGQTFAVPSEGPPPPPSPAGQTFATPSEGPPSPTVGGASAIGPPALGTAAAPNDCPCCSQRTFATPASPPALGVTAPVDEVPITAMLWYRPRPCGSRRRLPLTWLRGRTSPLALPPILGPCGGTRRGTGRRRRRSPRCRLWTMRRRPLRSRLRWRIAPLAREVFGTTALPPTRPGTLRIPSAPRYFISPLRLRVHSLLPVHVHSVLVRRESSFSAPSASLAKPRASGGVSRQEQGRWPYATGGRGHAIRVWPPRGRGRQGH